MANPNIVNVTSILANTSTLLVSTTASNIVSNPASSGAVYKINSISVANINSVAGSITAELNVAGSNSFIARTVSVPSSSLLVLIGKDSAIYLLENSSIQLTASTNTTLQAICSYEQIS